MRSFKSFAFICALAAVFALPAFSVVHSQGATVGGQTNNTTDSGPTVGGITNNTNGTFTLSNPLKVNSIGDLIQNFVEIFSYLVILLAVLALIYVGFLYIVSQGKPEKRKELNNWLFYIVIGVAVVISARLIVNVVINTLSATGTVNPNVIQSAKNAANRN